MPGQQVSRRARAATRPPFPVAVTKRLVAHMPYRWQQHGPGPRDGDPVGLPVPCARLRAGYWCECSSGFGRHFEEAEAGRTPQARIEPAPIGTTIGYLEDAHPFLGVPHGQVTPEDERALQLQIEALPVGAVVERFGIGIAPGFDELRGSASTSIARDASAS